MMVPVQEKEYKKKCLLPDDGSIGTKPILARENEGDLVGSFKNSMFIFKIWPFFFGYWQLVTEPLVGLDPDSSTEQIQNQGRFVKKVGIHYEQTKKTISTNFRHYFKTSDQKLFEIYTKNKVSGFCKISQYTKILIFSSRSGNH